MSGPGPILADIDLHAYVDGELSEAEAREVEARIASDPRARAVVASLGVQRAALLAKYALPVECPVTQRMAAGVRNAGRTSPHTWVRAAAVGGVAAVALLGAAAGYGLRGQRTPVVAAQEPGFVATARGAHRVFVPEVRHPVEVAASDLGHLTYWLSKRVGSPIKPPDLAALGWSLIGGRLLADGTQPAAQLMYEDRGGRRLTLFMRTESSLGNTAFQFAERDRLATAYWIDQPLAYAIAGEVGRDDLLGLAKAVHAALTPLAKPAEAKP